MKTNVGAKLLQRRSAMPAKPATITSASSATPSAPAAISTGAAAEQRGRAAPGSGRQRSRSRRGCGHRIASATNDSDQHGGRRPAEQPLRQRQVRALDRARGRCASGGQRGARGDEQRRGRRRSARRRCAAPRDQRRIAKKTLTPREQRNFSFVSRAVVAAAIAASAAGASEVARGVRARGPAAQLVGLDVVALGLDRQDAAVGRRHDRGARRARAAHVTASATAVRHAPGIARMCVQCFAHDPLGSRVAPVPGRAPRYARPCCTRGGQATDNFGSVGRQGRCCSTRR